jgi:hypothetical protein
MCTPSVEREEKRRRGNAREVKWLNPSSKSDCLAAINREIPCNATNAW